LKKPDPALNAKIFHLCVNGLSNRAIGRFLKLSEHCVRIRLERMARTALCFQSEILKSHKITEVLCMDGIENFSSSQYDVNNIQQALGKESLFIYDFNFASLNRKGYTSDRQKMRLREIEKDYGRFDSRSIRWATRDLIARLHQSWGLAADFTLCSDEHYQYRHALNSDLKHLRISHLTVSSKATRNFQNILFSVNHADLLIRQKLAAFARETISFSKSAGAMCQKYALFMIFKNFMAPQFTKPHVRRPQAHEKSPAEIAGITAKTLRFEDIFSGVAYQDRTKALNMDWKYFYFGQVPPAHRRSPQFKRKLAA
jgi:hypothetical protein